jgi:general secretion pathway protein A
MYETHFGLKQRPFRSTPDNDSYYPATHHERALARLQHALRDDEGLILLTGAPGIGKTLLCHRLLEMIGGEVTCAFLTNSHVHDQAGLFQAILYDLSLPHEGRTEQELRLALTDHLLKNFGSGRRGLIIIDEAQHLGADLLEELRLLGNLESRHGKAVQVILAAQPSMEDRLRHPELAGFRQRLAVRLRLEPLDANEAGDYLFHQLRMASGKPESILSSEAVELLVRAAHGIPRVLNQAAHQALTLACEAGQRTVDAEAVLEALALLELEAESSESASSIYPAVVPVDDAESSVEVEEEAGNSGRLLIPARPA